MHTLITALLVAAFTFGGYPESDSESVSIPSELALNCDYYASIVQIDTETPMSWLCQITEHGDPVPNECDDEECWRVVLLGSTDSGGN